MALTPQFGSVAVQLRNCGFQKEEIMLHLIWYVIVGFLAGCVAKALLHPAGLIVSILGAILVLYLWHKFRLQLPRG